MISCITWHAKTLIVIILIIFLARRVWCFWDDQKTLGREAKCPFVTLPLALSTKKYMQWCSKAGIQSLFSQLWRLFFLHPIFIDTFFSQQYLSKNARSSSLSVLFLLPTFFFQHCFNYLCQTGSLQVFWSLLFYNFPIINYIS